MQNYRQHLTQALAGCKPGRPPLRGPPPGFPAAPAAVAPPAAAVQPAQQQQQKQLESEQHGMRVPSSTEGRVVIGTSSVVEAAASLVQTGRAAPAIPSKAAESPSAGAFRAGQVHTRNSSRASRLGPPPGFGAAPRQQQHQQHPPQQLPAARQQQQQQQQQRSPFEQQQRSPFEQRSAAPFEVLSRSDHCHLSRSSTHSSSRSSSSSRGALLSLLTNNNSSSSSSRSLSGVNRRWLEARAQSGGLLQQCRADLRTHSVGSVDFVFAHAALAALQSAWYRGLASTLPASTAQAHVPLPPATMLMAAPPGFGAAAQQQPQQPSPCAHTSATAPGEGASSSSLARTTTSSKSLAELLDLLSTPAASPTTNSTSNNSVGDNSSAAAAPIASTVAAPAPRPLAAHPTRTAARRLPPGFGAVPRQQQQQQRSPFAAWGNTLFGIAGAEAGSYWSSLRRTISSSSIGLDLFRLAAPGVAMDSAAGVSSVQQQQQQPSGRARVRVRRAAARHNRVSTTTSGSSSRVNGGPSTGLLPPWMDLFARASSSTWTPIVAPTREDDTLLVRDGDRSKLRVSESLQLLLDVFEPPADSSSSSGSDSSLERSVSRTDSGRHITVAASADLSISISISCTFSSSSSSSDIGLDLFFCMAAATAAPPINSPAQTTAVAPAASSCGALPGLRGLSQQRCAAHLLPIKATTNITSSPSSPNLAVAPHAGCQAHRQRGPSATEAAHSWQWRPVGSSSNSSSSSSSLAAGVPPEFGHRWQQQQQQHVSNVRHSSTTSAARRSRLNPLAPAFWPQQCAQGLVNTNSGSMPSAVSTHARDTHRSASSRRSSSRQGIISTAGCSSVSQGSSDSYSNSRRSSGVSNRRSSRSTGSCRTCYVHGDDGWGWDVVIGSGLSSRGFGVRAGRGVWGVHQTSRAACPAAGAAAGDRAW